MRIDPKRIFGICCLLSVVATATNASAQSTLHVDAATCPPYPVLATGDPLSPYCTVQDAINAASNGDQIIVAAGLQSGSTMNFRGKSIALIGPAGPAATTIQTAASGDSAEISNGETVTIEGITILATDAPLVYCAHNSTVTVRNCILDGPTYNDPGVAVKYGGHLILEDSFVRNHVEEGIRVYPGSSVVIDGSTIQNNEECGVEVNGDAVIRNSLIQGNQGGGISINGTGLILNSHIDGNLGRFGAGVAAGGYVVIRNSIISRNSSISGGTGSAIYASGESLFVENSTIAENTGVGDSIRTRSDTYIRNTILRPRSTSGRHIFAQGIAADPIEVHISFSSLRNGPSDVEIGNDVSELQLTDNITGDPGISLATFALLSTSTCINTGDPNFTPEPGETDYFGGPRVLNSTVDIGADEFGDLDCNGNGQFDALDIQNGTSEDCDDNEIPDECQSDEDCNSNGTRDICDLANGIGNDCNSNELLDACEPDCNANGVPDNCDVVFGSEPDCNRNLIPDECDIASGAADDCNANGIPDSCDPDDDCTGNGIQDTCDIHVGAEPDCDGNEIPDACDSDSDCNANGVPDDCDIAGGFSDDCNANEYPDECESLPPWPNEDCNSNGELDACDIYHGVSVDCNENEVPDDCDIANGTSVDIVGTGGVPDGIPDDCQGDCSDPIADGQLYWVSNYDLFRWDCPDTTTVVPHILGLLRSVAVDPVGERIYWGGVIDPVIQRSNLDGSNVQTVIPSCCLLGGGGPEYIQIDAARQMMYWTSPYTEILRSSLDGINIEQIVPADSAKDGLVLHAEERKLYWAVRDNANWRSIIQQSNLDGTHIRNLYSSDDFIIDMDIEPNDRQLYFTQQTEDAIHRLDLASGSVELVKTGPGGHILIDPHNQLIYASGLSDNGLVRMNYNGDVDSSFLLEITGNGGEFALDFGPPDCNDNGIVDQLDISSGTSTDCNASGIPDECEPDCNSNGITDECDISAGTSADCDNSWIPDECEPAEDCNNNGIQDICDIGAGTSDNCNLNDIPDECEYPIDCNSNGQQDLCDIAFGSSQDCNLNETPDDCESDCNGNGVPDDCDLDDSTSADCNTNFLPDECDIAAGTSEDCNANGIPDECISLESDCNTNSIPDACDIAAGTSIDCQSDGIPDECFPPNPDCNNNGIADECDILELTSPDCNNNGIPDECDIASGNSPDCQSDGIPDSCQPNYDDCNMNSLPDECDILSGASEDCNINGTPDECEPDCNGNGAPDQCELINGDAVDCDLNGIIDVCDECDTEECFQNYPPPAPCCPFSRAPVASLIASQQSNPVVLTSNRYLVLQPRNAGKIKAIRVRLLDLPVPYNVWNGAEMWVGTPSDVSEHGSSTAPLEGYGTFKAASLQCTPVYRDWGGEPTLHVVHEGIIPEGSYEVDIVDIDCDLSDPESFSASVNLVNALWGDTLTDLSTTPPGPPNGITSILDVLGILGRFSGDPDAISKARADLEPACIDLRINITDVVAGINAFASAPYPFAPTAANPCNSTCVNPLP